MHERRALFYIYKVLLGRVGSKWTILFERE